MPPSPHDLQHYQHVFIAYKAKVQSIITEHAKAMRKAMQHVDAQKAREIQNELRGESQD